MNKMRFHGRFILLFPLLLTLLVCVTCRFGASRRNVLLITVDTLRADRLRCYGSKTVKTPGMDALAAQGVLFEETVTPVPLTLPAHASILTGFYPVEHGARDNGYYKLPKGFQTLPKVLNEAGYYTAAFVSSSVLNAHYGLDQGFDLYVDLSSPSKRTSIFYNLEISANEVTEDAISLLNNDLKKPFFLWVHYFDPHAPYQPPEPYLSNYNNPYDGEVAFVDNQIGILINELKKRGLKKNTLVILTSDHGEGLGEHNERRHGLFLYHTTLKVPLIMSGPGLPDGKRIKSLASLLDITPTLLSYLGIDSELEYSGIDLMPVIKKEIPDSSRAVYIETVAPADMMGWSPLKGLCTHKYKFISAPAKELYDLQSDPGEQNNIIDSEKKISMELSDGVTKFEARFKQFFPSSEAMFFPDDVQRQDLAALGYFGDRVTGRKQADNPSDMTKILDYYYDGTALLKGGDTSGALEIFGKAIKLDPDNPLILHMIASGLTQIGDFENAERKFKTLLAFDADRCTAWRDLAILYVKMKKLDEAQKCANKAISFEPNIRETHYIKALVARARGNLKEAIDNYKVELQINPRHYFATKELGTILLRNPETKDEGLRLLKRAEYIRKGS